MVCVMCSYCEYLGQGNSLDEQIQNVLKHELECKYKKSQD